MVDDALLHGGLLCVSVVGGQGPCQWFNRARMVLSMPCMVGMRMMLMDDPIAHWDVPALAFDAQQSHGLML
jgi:hypothetical protein